MIRTSIAITLAAGIAALTLGGCVAPGAPAPATSAPCPAALDGMVQDTVRRALPAATTIACTTYQAEAAEGKPGAPAGAPGNAGLHVEARTALSDGRVATFEVSSDGKAVHGITYAHGHTDQVDSSGWEMAVLFWLFALISVAGALFVISRKNLIAAVMGMVGSFLGIAAIYMMLYAEFLAVVQMLVYAGAIMVLFVFVIMILNRPEDEPVAPSGRAGQILGGAAILYLVYRLIMVLTQVVPPDAELANAAPLPAGGHDWGSVAAVGTDLFNGGLFPFEAISILLLVAVVGAIAIARPLKADDDGDDPTRSLGHGPAASHRDGRGGHSQGGAA